MEENLKQLPSGPKKIIKIALFGPESTGKTTLAKQLAEYYKTDWVPEFARDYLQEKWDKHQTICDVNDMLPIAYGQTQLENQTLATQHAGTYRSGLLIPLLQLPTPQRLIITRSPPQVAPVSSSASRSF
jgi:GTPase SAR1 family protein